MVFFESYSAFLSRHSAGRVRARFFFHLTTALSPKPCLTHVDVHWQTQDRPVHVPSWDWGICRHCNIMIQSNFICIARNHNSCLKTFLCFKTLPWHIENPNIQMTPYEQHLVMLGRKTRRSLWQKQTRGGAAICHSLFVSASWKTPATWGFRVTWSNPSCRLYQKGTFKF